MVARLRGYSVASELERFFLFINSFSEAEVESKIPSLSLSGEEDMTLEMRRSVFHMCQV